MLTCNGASHLVSESQDRPLKALESWSLRIHLWKCRNCRRFERQIGLMRRVLRQSSQHTETEAVNQSLSVQARERIPGYWKRRAGPIE
ncbi:MAG: anti-sigma factor family protein [Thiobacillus sp.]